MVVTACITAEHGSFNCIHQMAPRWFFQPT